MSKVRLCAKTSHGRAYLSWRLGIVLLAFALCLSLVAPATASAANLYFDGFESGGFGP